MTSFVDSYFSLGSPEADDQTRLAISPTFDVLDITKPICVSGLVVLNLDAATTALRLEILNDDDDEPIGAPVTYNVDAVATAGGTYPWAIDVQAPPGRLGTMAVNFYATATSAVGDATALAVALHVRYD